MGQRWDLSTRGEREYVRLSQIVFYVIIINHLSSLLVSAPCPSKFPYPFDRATKCCASAASTTGLLEPMDHEICCKDQMYTDCPVRGLICRQRKDAMIEELALHNVDVFRYNTNKLKISDVNFVLIGFSERGTVSRAVCKSVIPSLIFFSKLHMFQLSPSTLITAATTWHRRPDSFTSDSPTRSIALMLFVSVQSPELASSCQRRSKTWQC